jgi:hypothetical protein
VRLQSLCLLSAASIPALLVFHMYRLALTGVGGDLRQEVAERTAWPAIVTEATCRTNKCTPPRFA